MTTTESFATTIDVRTIPPRERHPLIFSSFDALEPGQALLLVNDHDPVPLRFQFQDRCSGRFEWTYLASGPELYRVQISKLQTQAAPTTEEGGSCCSGGACGG